MICPPWLLCIPLVAQGLLMMFDEFYFHRKRGLPPWEIIGHPLDTLTVIAPLFYAYSNDYKPEIVTNYILLSFFSCLFIIKDEIIHKDICSKGEMLLHALLFICHPLVFLSVFFLWQQPAGSLFGLIELSNIIFGQLVITTIFLVYQLFLLGGFKNDSGNKQRHLP